ncbi:MAG: hypothetical protein JWM02_759 [Frankiales bacterium]|nr:hypothetical protein [Frankiales bacterium]
MTDPFNPPTGDQPQRPVSPYGTPVSPPPYPAPPYGAPQYGAPLYGAPIAGPTRNGFGVAALVLGIASLVLFWVPALDVVLAVLAIVFAALGRKRAARHEATNGGMAIAGLVCGILGLIGAALITAFVLYFHTQITQYQHCLNRAGADPAARTACNVEFQNDVTR